MRLAAQPDDHIAQRAIGDVEYARPLGCMWIDLERIAVVEMVVDEGGAKVVRGSDGVNVTGQMQVDVLHRNHLRVSATGGASVDAEHRAE